MADGGRRKASSGTRLAASWQTAVLYTAALLGVACLLSTIVVLALGLKPTAVGSSSMAPAIESGDLILARHVPADDIGVGDIVSVDTRSGQRVTHRVASLRPFGSSIRLTLRADRAAAPDAEAYEVTSVDKVVTVVPWAGHVVGSPLGLVVCGLFIAAAARVLFVPGRRLHGVRRAVA